VQGDGLQTGFRPSKGGNEAMPTHIFSETGSDYIVQANLLIYSTTARLFVNPAQPSKGRRLKLLLQVFSICVITFFCIWSAKDC